TVEQLASLKTPFRPHGRVTAGNAAGLNDGATAAILADEETANELGLPVAMRLVGYSFVGVEPEVMGIGPVPATEKLFKRTGLSIDDIGLFEINEAFAVQVLAFLDHFGIADDAPRVNVWGGANAFGPQGLVSLNAALDVAFAAEPAAIAVTGKPFIFAVGADLSGVEAVSDPKLAREIAQTGHDVFRRLTDSKIPTFGFVNGAVM